MRFPPTYRSLIAVASIAAAALWASPALAGAAERDYVVLLKGGESIEQAVAGEKARDNDVVDVFKSRVRGFVASLTPGDVQRLRADDSVLLVERDKPVRALALGARDSQAPSWGLDRVDQRQLPLNGRIATSHNGFGVAAYIIDTGVYGGHQELAGRMSGNGFDAVGDGNGYNDCHGHGTHVAGTVAGSTYGVAPEATVVPVRVLGCTGSGSTAGVIAGVDWAVSDHAAGQPAVANMSLGGGYSSALNLAITRATSDGIAMAVAAGNSSADACNYSPASAPSAITVGSTTAQDQRSSFSNTGSCVDVFAPGSSISSAYIGSPGAVATMSGTSMASPHVAGAAALYLSANRSASPATVTSAITSNATPGFVTDPGAGSPNLLLYSGTSTAPPPEPPPPPPPPPTPANDAFANASALGSLASVDATTVGATSEAGEPVHANVGGGKSTWHSWTATQSGTLELNTQGSAYDTALAVYTGSSVAGLTGLGANDDNGSGGLWSRVVVPVKAGTTYRIAVDGYRGAAGAYRLQGSFTPESTPAPTPPPENDDFANASPLAAQSPATGTTVGATREDGEPNHVGGAAGGQASIWYRWTAPADGAVTVSTEGSDFDTLLAAYQGGSLATLQQLAANDDAAPTGRWSRVSFAARSGVTYRIAVDGYSGRTGRTALATDFTATPEPPPTEPTPPEPDPVIGMLLPLDTQLTVSSRVAPANFVCQSLAGPDEEDADCEALVRLRTKFGSSARAVSLAVGGVRRVGFRVSRRVARIVNNRGSLSARLTVTSATDSAFTYQLNLVSSREAARKRGAKRR